MVAVEVLVQMSVTKVRAVAVVMVAFTDNV